MNNTSKSKHWDLPPFENGGKITIHYDHSGKKKIGYLKKEAVSLCAGDIIVELDHDDALEPNALEKIAEAFQSDPLLDFVYSSCYEYRDGKTAAPFGSYYGWRYSHESSPGGYTPKELIDILKQTGTLPLPSKEDDRIITHGFPPSPASFGYIWYAPNHVRAWRKEFYDLIGGHDEKMDVCDDHDLCCRTYIQGNVKFIDEPLYQYHPSLKDSTSNNAEKNKRIQELTRELHDKYIEQLCQKWCQLNNLSAFNLCSHTEVRPGYKAVDKYHYPNVDIVCDLDSTWNIGDNSVGLFRLQDAIEHLKDPIHTMKELHRCLAPGGFALIEVPSTDGRGAFQDPTHVSFWNSNSFWYYTNQTAQYINTPVKFQLNRILDYFPSDWHKLHNIPYVKAHLMKLGDEVPPGGRDL